MTIQLFFEMLQLLALYKHKTTAYGKTGGIQNKDWAITTLYILGYQINTHFEVNFHLRMSLTKNRLNLLTS